MQNFTREQLMLINDIKKTLGSEFIWKYLEYLRIEMELGHSPSIDELVANAGETTYGSWCIAVGAFKEAGYLKEKTRMQSVEELLWQSNFQDTLWECIRPYTNDDGFVSVDHRERAKSAVRTLCETKRKACPDKSDIIDKCEDEALKNVDKIWNNDISI